MSTEHINNEFFERVRPGEALFRHSLLSFALALNPQQSSPHSSSGGRQQSAEREQLLAFSLRCSFTVARTLTSSWTCGHFTHYWYGYAHWHEAEHSHYRWTMMKSRHWALRPGRNAVFRGHAPKITASLTHHPGANHQTSTGRGQAHIESLRLIIQNHVYSTTLYYTTPLYCILHYNKFTVQEPHSNILRYTIVQ